MKQRLRVSLLSLLSVGILILGTTVLNSAAMKQRNVVDLITLSDLILVGKVVEVSDGVENNLPYTQITLEVDEAIRGSMGQRFTFRQFGLLKPRVMEDGKTNLNVTPDGWPTYAEGEKVVLFLYKPASRTGLRTTVGLFQGKFTIRDGQVFNRINNQGLFDQVTVQKQLLSKGEYKLLSNARGAVPAETFISLVRKAVRQHWVENRRMRHEKK